MASTSGFFATNRKDHFSIDIYCVINHVINVGNINENLIDPIDQAEINWKIVKCLST